MRTHHPRVHEIPSDLYAPAMPLHPLAPEDLVAHFTRPADGAPIPGAPQPYEWWYFEFHFPGPARDPEGEPLPGAGPGMDDWVIVLSFHLPHFLDPVRLMDVSLGGNARGEGTQIHPTFDYSGLAISIYRCTPTRPLIHTLVGFSATRTTEAFASTTRPFYARWGHPAAPVVELKEMADGSYRIRVDDQGWWAEHGLVDTKFQGRRVRELQIDMDLRFSEHSPGFKVDDGVLVHDRWGGEHHWVLRMPDARVTGRVELRAEGRTVLRQENISTIGYHDHQWGPHLPSDVMHEWSWGRVLVTPDERPDDQDLMVFFRSLPIERDADPGVAPRGADTLVYVPAGRMAVALDPPAGRDAVVPGGWDDVNYPLKTYDPVEVVAPEARILPDVCKSLVPGRPRSGPPYYLPPDDSRFSFWGWLAMLVGRPLARRRLRHEIGYWGVVTCHGRGPTGDDGAIQEHELVITQRGATIEPWPFYNRYIPRAAVSRGSGTRRRDRIQFALSEYIELHELLHLRPPRRFMGKPIHEDLLGMAIFSEFMTTIHPGAPKLRHLLAHFK